MYKYAEIYGGKVRDIKESHLKFVEFCSIWDPRCFWMDVTGVDDIGIGWVMKSNSSIGIYFEEPISIEDNLEMRKNAKLELLTARFLAVVDTAYLISSLGFRANAGQRAKSDVDGLITSMEEENINIKNFRDYDNLIQELTLDELKTLRLEIIKNGEYIYYQKWEYESAIKNCETIDDVEDIIISFKMMDFINKTTID
mgnify:CR=1 FL=1